MTDILMPRLSDSMEEGTILTWLKREGEHVEVGEDLVEIETDKATVTHQADASGTLSIVAGEGTSVRVGEPIAHLGVADAAPGPAPAAPAPAPSETPIGSSAVSLRPAPAEPAAGDRSAANGAAPRATPLAKRVAAAHGVALADVAGSGPLGRITRSDVLARAGLSPSPSPIPVAPPATAAAPRKPTGAAAAATEPVRDAGGKGQATHREPTRLQQVVARRMAEANANVPHFQVQTEVVMDAAVALRGELKRLAPEPDAVPSFNDLIIKAAATALRDHPLANGAYTDGGFELYERINIGMAVAADGALVVPTIFDVAGKSLGEIARESRRLAALVRDGGISPRELSGGTFTVSNLGMFGMTAITPVINVPQAAILGVGAIREVLARVDGEIVDRTLMTLTLSCDHRILYGADAARFLAQIRQLLEEPLMLAL